MKKTMLILAVLGAIGINASAVIPWQTLDSGGNTSQSPGFVALHSVGQSSAIGLSGSGNHRNAAGFYAHRQTLVCQGIPAAVTAIAPIGVIGTATPTYTWKAVPCATQYHLWVSFPPANVLLDHWYRAADVCRNNGFCSVTPSISLNRDEDYVWKLRAGNTYGDGPETDLITFAYRITLSKLHVDGNRILNEFNEPVVLRGVCIPDPSSLETTPWYQGLREEDFRVLGQDWKAQIIRVPILPSYWRDDPEYAAKYLDPIVNWGTKYNMYIFLGWHAHGNPITEHNNDGCPECLPDKDLALSALHLLAARYQGNPGIIYGTFNEPGYITWNEFQPVAEELVDAIHAADPTAVAMVSGVDWASTMEGILANPVNRPNVIYEAHPYPWTFTNISGGRNNWAATVDALSQHYPVFLGEWGYDTHPTMCGDYCGMFTEHNYGQPLLDFCLAHQIGWTAWNWHDFWGPQMFTSMETYTTTAFGDFIKRTLIGTVPAFPQSYILWTK